MDADTSARDVADAVVALAAEVFEVDKRNLGMDASPETVDRWDSLNHLKLITAVESHFGIQFRMQTVLQIQTMAALVAAVESHRRR